jgi:ribosomal protein S18 acetylase RimI-like enzyme
MLIREFRQTDPPALWRVFFSAVHETAVVDYSPEQIEAWAPSQPDTAKWAARMEGIRPFVAEIHGQIVGYADLQDDGYIDHFFVAAATARRGVGSALMRWIHEQAANRQIRCLYSNVSIAARRFFARFGFQVEATQEVPVRGVILSNFRMQKALHVAQRAVGPVVSPERIEAARELFREYAAELRIDLCFQSFEDELALLPGKYAWPSGGLWLAVEDGEPCGCVGLRKVDADTCEMKRLFVRPAFRQTGLGRVLALEAIEAARQIGYRRMVLDTLERLQPALALYESLGFNRTAPYYDNPMPDAVFLERTL